MGAVSQKNATLKAGICMSSDEMNLVPAIREIKRKIESLRSDYDAELRQYQNALDCLRKLNTVCENCDGTGQIFVQNPAGYNIAHITCPTCKGTGRA